MTDGLEGTLTENRYWSGEVLITGNIIVNSSDTLTVHEGTKISFEDNSSLFIQGNLQAVGAPGHHIKFTSVQGDFSPGSWNYIRIVNTSENSNLTYCDIYSASTGLVIENVTGTVTLDECRIKNNSIGILAQNSSGSISIENSTIEYNQTGVWLNNTRPSIKYTVIKQNSGKGLYMYNQSNASFGYDEIYDNGEGIYCYYNTIPSIYGSAGHNWIYNNSNDAVSGRSNSYPKLGFDILVKYGYNHIYSNTGYEVANYNSGSSYIMAERNYWSASETNPVPPQDTYGLVDWDPVLPPGPPAKSNYKNPALMAEVNEDYQQAADEYYKQIDQSPNSDDAGFAVSGLVRCYEAMGKKSEITAILADLISKYAGTATEISAKELSLPFLLQEDSIEKGLERSEELLDVVKSTDREVIFLYEKATFHLARSGGKAGEDYNKVVELYREIVERFPKSDLALWASIWLRTHHAGSLGKFIQTGDYESFDQAVGYGIGNFPNPFNLQTSIRFTLPEAGRILLKIYDLSGREVVTLINAEKPAGTHTVTWNSHDRLGREVASGVYFYRLQFKNQVKSGKMILMR